MTTVLPIFAQDNASEKNLVIGVVHVCVLWGQIRLLKFGIMGVERLL
jgi:hypothetical protein